MKLGIIGMGKMGYALALNGVEHGIEISALSSSEEKAKKLAVHGVDTYMDMEPFVDSLPAPRVIWLMVPAGEPVDDMIEKLMPLLEVGDTIIDGGNSYYADSIKRHGFLKSEGINFLDAGTSGGTEGARYGACIMVGGDKAVYDTLEPLFKALSQSSGCGWMGPAGNGHYVKMVHNGIEYGMMQAIGEGLELLRTAPGGFDLAKVTEVWQKGSIVSGLLMDVTAAALQKEPDLQSIEGIVATSGEAEWTLQESIRHKVSMPVIAASLFARFKSGDKEKFSEKSVAAMRREFGGHAVTLKQEDNQ